MTTLRKDTLAEQAYQALRDQIVQGELSPGQRLLPEALGQALAISPTPVKEALAMLQADGLVAVEARRYSAVRSFSPREIEDLYVARFMVERHAITAGFAAGRADAAFLARVDTCAVQFATRVSRRSRADLRHALRLDHDLHTLFVTLADNPVIADWHQRLLRQTQLARAYTFSAYDAGRLARAQREHVAIIEAMRARRLAAAVQALDTHLATSRRNIVRDQS